MNCDERKDQIALYALGALDGGERQELEKHIQSGCAACNGAIADARNVAAQLAWELDPVLPPASVRDRIMKRVGADISARIRSPKTHGRSWRFSDWAKALVPSAAAAGIAALAVSVSFQGEMSRLKQQVVALQRQVGSLQTTADDQQLMLKSINLPERPIFKLASASKTADNASGEIAWNSQRNNWVLSVHGLPPLPPQKVYELWYIINGAPKPVEAFVVDPFGNGIATLPMPKDVSKIAVVAITSENSPGSSTPTMPLLLKGTVVAD